MNISNIPEDFKMLEADMEKEEPTFVKIYNTGD